KTSIAIEKAEHAIAEAATSICEETSDAIKRGEQPTSKGAHSFTDHVKEAASKAGHVVSDTAKSAAVGVCRAGHTMSGVAYPHHCPYLGHILNDESMEVGQALGVTLDNPDLCTVSVDVSRYKPNEIKVNRTGHELMVDARFEERCEEGGTTLRSFSRKFTLPDDAKLKSCLSLGGRPSDNRGNQKDTGTDPVQGDSHPQRMSTSASM
ncbi:hypothetical protein PENTCL1PPCAC_20074, partial [Pristionchus entomophagus]